jgi:hypothetical protein
MLVKSLIAVAAVASAVSFASTAAKADTTVSLGFGFGGFGPDYGYSDYGYPGPYYGHRPHHGFYGDFRPARRGISCGTGRSIVRNAGFHRVVAYDCSAPTYGYKAWQDGELYQVKVSSRGDIISARPIY